MPQQFDTFKCPQLSGKQSTLSILHSCIKPKHFHPGFSQNDGSHQPVCSIVLYVFWCRHRCNFFGIKTRNLEHCAALAEVWAIWVCSTLIIVRITTWHNQNNYTKRWMDVADSQTVPVTLLLSSVLLPSVFPCFSSQNSSFSFCLRFLLEQVRSIAEVMQ